MRTSSGSATNGEPFVAEPLDVRMQGEQAMLPVDRAQDAFPLRDLEDAERRPVVDRLELQRCVARDDDGAGERWQVTGLKALLVARAECASPPADGRQLGSLLPLGVAACER